MRITELSATAIYDADDKLVAISVNDEKSRKVVTYTTEEMGFREFQDFLIRVTKNGLGLKSPIKSKFVSIEDKSILPS